VAPQRSHALQTGSNHHKLKYDVTIYRDVQSHNTYNTCEWRIARFLVIIYLKPSEPLSTNPTGLTKFNLVHAEDYYNVSDGNNEGVTCANVFVTFERPVGSGAGAGNGVDNSAAIAPFVPYLEFQAFGEDSPPFPKLTFPICVRIPYSSGSSNDANLVHGVCCRGFRRWQVSSSRRVLRMNIELDAKSCANNNSEWSVLQSQVHSSAWLTSGTTCSVQAAGIRFLRLPQLFPWNPAVLYPPIQAQAPGLASAHQTR